MPIAKTYIKSQDHVNSLKPGEVAWDRRIPGLHARAMPKSGKIKYYLYYRTPWKDPKTGRTKERRPALGDLAVTLDEARMVAIDWLQLLRQGVDPLEHKHRQQQEMLHQRALFDQIPTVAELADKYVEMYRDDYKNADNLEGPIRLYIKPTLGSIKIDDLKLLDVEMVHRKMSSTPYAANRMLSIMSILIKFAEKHEYRDKNDNFMEYIKRYKEKSRRRYMTPDEAERLARGFAHYQGKHPHQIAFLLILLMTGARRSEIANAKWEHIKGNRLILTEHKTDRTGEERIIVLTDPVLRLLDKLPKTIPMRGPRARGMNKRLQEGYIVAVANPDRIWAKVCAYAQIDNLRIHDLRHSFASYAMSADVDLAQIGGLLGHASTSTTQRYAHLVDDKGLEATEQTGEIIDAMMNGILAQFNPTGAADGSV